MRNLLVPRLSGGCRRRQRRRSRIRAFASTVVPMLCLIVGLNLLGCTTRSEPEIRDLLSAGSSKLFLDKGETTQAEVLESFGGPNIVTGGADGNETWTYDRMSYFVTSKSAGGIGGAGGILGSVPVGGLLWGNVAKASTSSRTMTLFLYWRNGVLADYKYRSASF